MALWVLHATWGLQMHSFQCYDCGWCQHSISGVYINITASDSLFTSTMAETEPDKTQTGKITFSSWKFRHYFKEESGFDDPVAKNITVSCKLCPKKKVLSTAKNTTSNLKKHLSGVHKNVQLEETPKEGTPSLTGSTSRKRGTEGNWGQILVGGLHG